MKVLGSSNRHMGASVADGSGEGGDRKGRTSTYAKNIAAAKARVPWEAFGSAAGIHLANKTPQWNPEISSLVLKFDRNRVQRASAKNFIMFKGEDLDATKSKDSNEAIMQFGKTQRGTYSCDFK
jgi:hypothetical protein